MSLDDDLGGALGDGPYAEPVRLWVDSETGLLCYARRHPEMGHWCGYSIVPHDWEVAKYWRTLLDEIESLEVHGGVTWTRDEPEGLVVGFDCGHYMDVIPWMEERVGTVSGATFKDLDYVMAQCAELALGLHRMESAILEEQEAKWKEARVR